MLVAQAEFGGREVLVVVREPPGPTLFPYTTLFRSGDVDRERVGRLVGVDAAVGGAAVVLDLEAEARIGEAVAVQARRVVGADGADVVTRDELAGRDGDHVELQNPGPRQRRDLDRGQ